MASRPRRKPREAPRSARRSRADIGHHAVVSGQDRSRGLCSCDDLVRLIGDPGRAYARDHLALVPPPADSAQGYPEYVADWTCPDRGWRWHSNFWDGWELRRRPRTTRRDYLSHRIIRERADAITHGQGPAVHSVDRGRESDADLAGWIAYEALFSPDWWDIVEDLRLGEASAVEPALVFLEVDPWCFRSGYAKEQLLRFLRRPRLDAGQIARLENVLISCTVAGPRREFPLITKLAHHIASDGFADKIREHAGSAAVSERARPYLFRLIPAGK
jgi:hypothetical protein